MLNNKNLKEIKIRTLFSASDSEYIIPIYQRNYAWTKKEIEQLIDDVNDYVSNDNLKSKNYYIGSLVVYRRDNGLLEVIDGQQRLTTLFILLNVLKNDYKIDFSSSNLSFESRIKSTNALKKISTDDYVEEDLNFRILDAKKIIENKLKNLLEVTEFSEFLLENVIILRVEVPKDTDLNHYFEIMNSRGEQLEKHEILKSRLLNKLKNDKKATTIFNQIWEACSNMEQYVQYGFNTKQRDKLFGSNWNEFNIENFDNMDKNEDSKNNYQNDSEGKPTIENIINGKYQDIKNIDNSKSLKDTPERFTSVINFPNFLLHVLKLQFEKDIPLDDKRLLQTFSENIKSKDEVKKFAYNLLKVRFLFDNYIIKRDFSKEQEGEWSLLQLIKNDSKSKNNTAYYKNRFNSENEHILMLLSMFHVSTPTLIYKHWLNASLKYLFEQKEAIEVNEYRKYLQDLAKVYMRDRFLNKTAESYHDIIYINKLKSQNINLEWGNLNCGTGVENFIFNYLDYLLWEKNRTTYSKFKFTFRTSVEHYYPQNPMDNISKLDKDILNNFGNLCLIHSSENSRLSNFTPKAKKEFYSKQRNNSIKQEIMMSYSKWEEKEIKEHYEEMKKVLDDSL